MIKLSQLSIADLIALKREFKDREKTCYTDMYLLLSGKKKEGPTRAELQQMANTYRFSFEAVANEIDRRIAAIAI